MSFDNDRIRFPGSGSIVSGSTPFGFYDNDSSFTKDCYNAMIWAARRLGYPIVDIELLDVNFYSAYEEAVNVYSAKVNQYNMINNMFALQGQQQNLVGNITGRAITGTGLPYIVDLATDYGSEAGTGGKVTWKKTHIDMLPGVQDYDLQALIGDVFENCNRIEVKRVFHNIVPASARVYDPFSMTGMSYSNILSELGFGAYSPAVQFLMTPIFEDLLRMQAIEFNDMVRKSAYSFELVNNNLRIFPIPCGGCKLWLEYVNVNDKYISGSITPAGQSVISDFSDVPYKNHTYNDINDPGRQWIRAFFLANCKEILGAIRQKYVTVPLPDGDMTLDGAELRSEAQQTKQELIENLQDMLEAAGKFAQMEKTSQFNEQLQSQLKGVPTFIYVG